MPEEACVPLLACAVGINVVISIISSSSSGVSVLLTMVKRIGRPLC